MKRWIGSLSFALVASLAAAQGGTFTIVRPADNSRVREKVRVLIPKGSIPSGGYVGVFLDGKFLEAVVPPLQGQYHTYVLDTKGRGMSDTPPGKPIRLEMVLYVDYKEGSRIVDRSSVDLNIANSSSISVPNSGISLRYRFKTGDEWVYRVDQRSTTYQISEAQNRAGGRAAELPGQSEQYRMLYAVDNTFGGGDALVRIQPMPLRGKTYAELTPTGGTQPVRYADTEMAPIYMRLTSTGKQVWASVPAYVPMEGTNGTGSVQDLYAPHPLPSLPLKNQRPGDSWPSFFQTGSLDLTNLFESNSVVKTYAARGEFVNVEWEMGRPCAKIRNKIEVGVESEEGKKLKKQNAEFTDDKVTLTETIWFALDKGQVLKVVRDVTEETKIENNMGMGGLGGGMPGMPGMGGVPGIPGGRGRTGGVGAPIGGPGDIEMNVPLRQLPPGAGRGTQGRPGGFPPGGGQMGGYPGMPGMGGYPGMGGMAGRQGTGAGIANTGGATYTRVRTQQIFTLER